MTIRWTRSACTAAAAPGRAPDGRLRHQRSERQLQQGPLGLVDGHAGQIWNQVIGCAIAWVLAIVGTLVILKICDALIGLRVTEQQEIEGLDVSMHGEEGYILES